MLPFWVSGIGIVGSMVGYYVVGTREGASQRDLALALHKGLFVASIIIVVVSAIVIHFFFEGRRNDGWAIFACIVVGLFAGGLIGQISEYFTAYSYWPTQSIAKANFFKCDMQLKLKANLRLKPEAKKLKLKPTLKLKSKLAKIQAKAQAIEQVQANAQAEAQAKPEAKSQAKVKAQAKA